MNRVPAAYEEVPVDSLRPHPRNPRRGDVDMIAESIGGVGFYGSVLVQASTRYIVAGEHRWRAAQRHNASTIPALLLDIDDPAAMRILLADNRTADLASYDDQTLADVLEGFLGRLDSTGYSADDLDDVLARLGGQVLPPQSTDADHAPTPERERAGNTRESSGLRDVVLVFQLDHWREYLEVVARLRRGWQVTAAPEVVLRAMREAAAAQ